MVIACLCTAGCTKSDDVQDTPHAVPAERSLADRSAEASPPPTVESKAQADSDSDSEDLFGESTRSRLCKADSPEFLEATKRLDELDTYAETLGPTDDASAFAKRFTALLRHRCFELAWVDQMMFSLDSEIGAEARHFWDAGAEAWLRNYLELASGASRTVRLMPSTRKVWTPKTHPSDPLAGFLCALDDADCAAAVNPWVERAHRSFDLWVDKTSTDPKDWGTTPTKTPEDCAAVALAASKDDAYAEWRQCERAQLSRSDRLPLGGLGVIDEGWLVVQGRRGHYEFCDGLSAYDLKTGAAYRFESCSELAVQFDGGVDTSKTDAGRTLRPEVGTIPVDALREAAWILLSMPHVDRNVVTDPELTRELPEGIEIARTGFNRSGLSMVGTASTAQTSLSWGWLPNDHDDDSIAGTLTWPGSLSDAVEDHAARRLAAAESRLRPGCAASPLPGWLAARLQRDPEIAPSTKARKRLRTAIREQASRGRCP